MNTEKLKDTLATFALFIFIGAAAGFFIGGGGLDLIRGTSSKNAEMRNNYRDKAMEPVSEEEYRSDTRTGAAVGGLLGTGLAAYFVFRPERKKQ